MTIEIPTERPGLVLRQFRASDSGALFQLIDRNREHLSQYTESVARRHPDEASVLSEIRKPADEGVHAFGIWNDSTLVGSAQVTRLHHMGALGYWVSEDHTRKGYATAAGIALSTYAIAHLGCRFLVATVHKENLASQEVLRRCGYVARLPSLDHEQSLCFLYRVTQPDTALLRALMR